MFVCLIVNEIFYFYSEFIFCCFVEKWIIKIKFFGFSIENILIEYDYIVGKWRVRFFVFIGYFVRNIVFNYGEWKFLKVYKRDGILGHSINL